MVNKSPKPRTTQFRQQEVVQADPEIALQTGWDSIDKTNWDSTEVGGGTTDPLGGGLYNLNVTAADGDLAALQTVNRVDYVPSMAALWGFAMIAENLITEDQRLRVGVTTRPTWFNSYRIQITGTPPGEENEYRFQVIKDGSTNIDRPKRQWKSNPMDIGWDETVGLISRNELGWYDFGEWKPEFQIPDLRDPDTNQIIDLDEFPDPDVRKVTVPMDYLSPVAETATDDVNFRIRAELENIGPNASANTVRFGNVHYNILGQNKPEPRPKDVERNGGGIGNGNITTTQPYPLVAVRVTEEDVPMALQSITTIPGTDSHEITAYLMRRENVTLTPDADTAFGPPPGLDTRECFFEDTDWTGIDSVERFDAAGTGNNDPHVGTEGYPLGRKIAGRTLEGGQGADKAGLTSGLDANANLGDLDYLVFFSRATETSGISLQALDYEMGVDR